MTSHEIALYLSHIATSSVLLPLFFILKKKQNFKNPILVILFCILFLGGLTDLFAYLISYVWKKPNMILLNIHCIIEVGLISILFIKIYPKLKATALVAGSLFLLLFLCTSIFWQPITTYQNITRVAAALLFIGYTAVYYRYLMKELPVDNILYHTPFWIVTAIFFYFGMSFYVFCLSSYVFNNMGPEYSIIFWVARGFSEIVKNIAFTIGIARFNKQKLPVSNL